MRKMLVFVLFAWVLWAGQDFCVKGVALSPCGDDNTAEVRQSGTSLFTCTHLPAGGPIVWYVSYNGNTHIAATCPTEASGQSCQTGGFGNVFTATRVSATSGRVEVDPSYANIPTFLQQGTLKCSGKSSTIPASCTIDYMVPANGSCSVQTGSGSSRFEVNGSCDLYPGAVSSRGRYRCEWFLNDQKSPVVSQDLNSANYETGCRFSGLRMPTTTGIHNYTVKVLPGRVILDAGFIEVERPAIPVISGCDSQGYREENTTVTCSCSTNSTGTVPGTLQWLREDEVIESGDHGNVTLPLSRLLTRQDHNVTFRCKVVWAVDVPEASISFLVGYPPTNASLTIHTQAEELTESGVTVVAVQEHQSVTFRCTSSEGIPQPTVTLVKRRGLGDGTDRRTVLGSGGTLGELRVRDMGCEGTGDYLCAFWNGVGPSEVLSEPKRLLVQCSPRLAKDFLRITFTHDVTSVHFDVISYPEVNQSLVEYLGASANQTLGFQLNKTKSDMGGDCRRPKPEVLYKSTCSLTMPRFDSEAPSGFYRVTIMNSLGNVSFVVEVKYDESRTLTPTTTTLTTIVTTRSTNTDVTKKDNNNNSNNMKDDEATVSSSYLWLATGLGSSALIICIVIIVILALLLCRQRHRQPDDRGDVTADGETYEIPQPLRERVNNLYTDMGVSGETENQDHPNSLEEDDENYYSHVEYSGSEMDQSSDRKGDDADTHIYLEPIPRGGQHQDQGTNKE